MTSTTRRIGALLPLVTVVRVKTASLVSVKPKIKVAPEKLLTTAEIEKLVAKGPKKGKYLYKKNCKTCHSAEGGGGELTPMSKTMSQWDRLFKKKKHKGGKEVWEKMKDKDLKDINQFLFDHAADSPSPQTCA